MITIKGIVIPANWDSRGNVVGVAIATHHEEEYLINDHDQVRKLKGFLRQEVQVSGVLTRKGGKNIIKIKSISTSKFKPDASVIPVCGISKNLK
jgi:hypothetical protein